MSSKWIIVIVVSVVLAVPILIGVGVVGLLAVAAIGGIGIGASESVAMIDDTPLFHTIVMGPHWSSDGGRIVFESHKMMYVTDVHGTQLQSISEDFGEDDFDFAPSLSPDGTQIVYTAVRHEEEFTGWKRNAELVMSPLDGSSKNTIVDGMGWEMASAWSPKGDRIAYVSGGSIYTTSTDGSDLQQVVTSSAIYHGGIFLPPVWSPNGEYMAFVADDRDNIDDDKDVVYVVEGDGSNLTELTETISGHKSGPYADDGREVRIPINQPAWSPDGRRLVFAKLEGEKVKVYTIDPDGSNPHEVHGLGIRQYADLWHGNLSWSPDGSEILMGNIGGVWSTDDPWSAESSWSFLPLSNLVIRSDGSGARELPGPGGYASWSPDGARIAVRLLTSGDPERDRGIELYTVARDGSDARVLVKRRHVKGEKRGRHGPYETIWILEAANGEPLTNFLEAQP